MALRGWTTSNFLDLGSAPITAPPMTFFCRFKTSIVGSAQCLVGLYNSASGVQFSIFIQADNTIACRSNDGSDAIASSGGAVTANNWFTACGVIASATDRRSFLNGRNKGTNATSRTPAGINQTTIGTSGSSGGGAPLAPSGTGDLCHVAIWNTALSDGDVLRAHLTNPISVMREFLVGYWPTSVRGGVNVIRPASPMVLHGTLTQSADDPAFVMPVPTWRLRRAA